MSFKHKHILGIEQMSKEDIETILDTADAFKEINSRDIKKVPTLRGKTIINAFFEASTRTRLSFEIAGKRLSADTVNISGSTSSVVKGETLEDTAKNIEAMAPDIIVIRHGHSGSPHYLAERVNCSVVNAGDGAHDQREDALRGLPVADQFEGHDHPRVGLVVVPPLQQALGQVRTQLAGFERSGGLVEAPSSTLLPMLALTFATA